jgi:hypothetical protein
MLQKAQSRDMPGFVGICEEAKIYANLCSGRRSGRRLGQHSSPQLSFTIFGNGRTIASLKGVPNQLRPIFKLKLAQNVAKVRLNSARANKEAIANLLVGKALNHFPKDFFFSRGQR